MRVGILHPGQMGASVGAAAVAAGHDVLWASEGRSGSTKLRAAEAGLTDVGSVEALAETSEVIVSVCPPAASEEVGRAVASAGFSGTFVEANAVSPTTTREVATIVTGAGAGFVDGGIIGPPAHASGTTRLYLSGDAAPDVARLFEGSVLQAIAIEGGPGAASALKVCYAAWTKGSAALLLDVRALAKAEGVEAPLLSEWALSQAELTAKSERVAAVNAPKGWRFEAEMREIAHAFALRGLPGGFHVASAEVYRRLADFKDADPAPHIDEVLAALDAGDG